MRLLQHCLACLVAAWLVGPVLGEEIQEEGIFADFTTTLGDFSVKLAMDEAPRTVANFVSLAEGSRPWIDPRNGAVRYETPFYEGIIFHRVMAGFMSQGGCPLGTGTSGPGYRFRDEFEGGLLHERHVISMANSGADSNGSQFFITDVPTPWLNGGHTVFGHVVAGGDVVDAINAVDTAPNDKPLEPVVIQSIAIRRVGAAADAFDVHAHDLPVVAGLPGRLEASHVGGVVFHMDPAAPRTFLQAHFSENLKDWTYIGQRYEDNPSITRDRIFLGPLSGDRAFLQFSQALYPDAAPSSMANRTLVVDWDNQTRTFNIGEDGMTGSFTSRSGLIATPDTIFETIVFPDLWRGEYAFTTNFSGAYSILVKITGTTPTHLTGSADVFKYNYTLAIWEIEKIGATFTLTR